MGDRNERVYSLFKAAQEYDTVTGVSSVIVPFSAEYRQAAIESLRRLMERQPATMRYKISYHPDAVRLCGTDPDKYDYSYTNSEAIQYSPKAKR